MKIKVYDIENKRLTAVDSIEFTDEKVTQVVTAPGRNQLFPGQFKLVHFSERQDAKQKDIYDGDIILVDSAFGTPHYSEVKRMSGMFKIDERPLNLFPDNELLVVGSIYIEDGKVKVP